MKSILLSKQPQIVANVLNEISKIIVCKNFPKDYVGWVYLYCTKQYNPSINIWRALDIPETVFKALCEYDESQADTDLDNFLNVEFVEKYPQYRGQRITFRPTNLNGKVIARFWCDKVEEITCRTIWGDWECYTKTLGYSEISQASCLKNKEIVHYLKGKKGYAIYISKLEVFDEPKILFFFNKYIRNGLGCPVKIAPKNYRYIESEE